MFAYLLDVATQNAWQLYRRSVASAYQSMDLLPFRKKLCHVCIMTQAACSHQATCWMFLRLGWNTLLWSIRDISIVLAQDVMGRPSTGVATVCIQPVSSHFTSLRLIRGETTVIHDTLISHEEKIQLLSYSILCVQVMYLKNTMQ